MNVFERAMQMELDGKAFYQKLAAETEMQGLKTIFNWLAGDEQKHYETFRALRDAAQVPEMQDSTALEGARDLFAEMQKTVKEQGAPESILEAYRTAMKAEKESAALYRQAAEQEENKPARQILLRIATEEEKHYNILENVFDFVNAPNQSLVWGEFSNLDEF